MIKIPEEKYNGLYNVHFNNIKDYLNDSIQFYINCCKIVAGDLDSSKYNENIKYYYNNKILKSLLAAISTESYNDIKDIRSIFDNNKIENEFKFYCKKIKGFLEQLVNNSSDIYIEKIITLKPNDLVILYKKILKCCKNIKNGNMRIISKKGIKDSVLKKIFSKIFNYERFASNGFEDKWNAYKLCEKLDVNVCPYCNRIYTFSVKKTNKNKSNHDIESIIRPELDHYFPQSRYPMFALSFFNLIPSCKICNSSIKGDKELDLKKNLHPYLNGISDKYKFDYKPLDITGFDGRKENLEVIITKETTDLKSDNDLQFFKINEIYKKHNDIVANLINRRKVYTEEMLDEIENILNFNTKITSKDELFKVTFNPPNEDEIINTSLGKLKKDIIDKLKSIK